MINHITKQIKQIEMICDCCDKCFEDDGYTSWNDDEDAEVFLRSFAEGSGWLITDDEHHYCWDCWGIEANEETDEEWIETKDGKRYELP